MYFLSTKASRARQREAQNARNNRAEIVKALSIGQISRRDLYRWGLLTTFGGLVLKNGLHPFASSAFAKDGGGGGGRGGGGGGGRGGGGGGGGGAEPTGTPLSPLF